MSTRPIGLPYLCTCSQRWRRALLYRLPMAAKYYTHFVTGVDEARATCEWSGVVELTRALADKRANKELRYLLAESFDLDSEEIRILHWARLH